MSPRANLGRPTWGFENGTAYTLLTRGWYIASSARRERFSVPSIEPSMPYILVQSPRQDLKSRDMDTAWNLTTPRPMAFLELSWSPPPSRSILYLLPRKIPYLFRCRIQNRMISRMITHSWMITLGSLIISRCWENHLILINNFKLHRNGKLIHLHLSLPHRVLCVFYKIRL